MVLNVYEQRVMDLEQENTLRFSKAKIIKFKYFNKKVIYARDKNMNDGGTVYWDRQPSTPDITAIEQALGEF